MGEDYGRFLVSLKSNMLSTSYISGTFRRPFRETPLCADMLGLEVACFDCDSDGSYCRAISLDPFVDIDICAKESNHSIYTICPTKNLVFSQKILIDIADRMHLVPRLLPSGGALEILMAPGKKELAYIISRLKPLAKAAGVSVEQYHPTYAYGIFLWRQGISEVDCKMRCWRKFGIIPELPDIN